MTRVITTSKQHARNRGASGEMRNAGVTCLICLLVLASLFSPFARSSAWDARAKASPQQQNKLTTQPTLQPESDIGQTLTRQVGIASSSDSQLNQNPVHSSPTAANAASAPITKPAPDFRPQAPSALVINPTFDSSITTNPNAAAIEAMINQAVAIYQARFSDPITVSILFRYATTRPDGTTQLPAGTLALSVTTIYMTDWNSFKNALTMDAKTSNDSTANTSLPPNPLSTNMRFASANGRALGFDTAGALCADGTFNCVNGTFDGIVTLNSNVSFAFTRPPGGSFDALRTTEHEMDEVLGFGSKLNTALSDLKPQDLFSWSSPGTRNLTSSGTRYFSINSGTTNIVNFSQDSNGDFGDWLSSSCPQANPYVQNAFGCAGQFSDVTATSPEGINLDVIGYDLVTTTATLRIDSVAPPAGRTSGGQQIKLTGEFAGLSTVTMGGSSASWFYTNGSSDTSMITETTPAHALGAVNIVLTPTSGSTLTKTNAFAYLPTVFTDNTIMVGQTTAKAQHILELRQAVDAMRAVAGLSGAPWNDPALAAGNTIRAVHITDLRTFLDDAATRLGFSTSPYTDPGLTTGFVIKRIHIEELRQRIRAIAG